MLTPTGPRAPRLTVARLSALLLFVLWLEGGYALILRAAGLVSWGAAWWQAALCMAAIPPLLLLVVEVVRLPKLFHRHLSRQAINLLGLAGNLAQLVLPLLGWAALLWALNGGPWARPLTPAGSIALFSYVTGAAILFLFNPRPNGVQLTRLDLPIPGLPPAFDGYTILHASDLHACWMLSPRRARARLSAAANVEADLIVFTGDLASDGHCVAGAAEALTALRGRDGFFAVPGNHDNWLGQKRVQAELAKHGVTMLVNEHTVLTRGGASLHLAGVDNAAYNRRDDLRKALAGIPEGAVALLLSHAPEIVTRPECARAALVLCGHTHGGQVVLPLVGAFYVPSEVGRRYASGLFGLGGGWLYINRGLGEIFPPIRILCPPEIALITLRNSGTATGFPPEP